MTQNFNELIQIVEKLLSPEGCQWDRDQTLPSLRPYLIEEVYEIVEAIDLDDNAKILEEVGDVFFHLVFICKLAEKENRFTMQIALQSIIDKLIRRHPHVFGSVKLQTVDEVVEQWEAIKKLEKNNQSRKSLLDDIPKDLPALAKAHKIAAKFNKSHFTSTTLQNENPILDFENEEQLGLLLYHIVSKAEKQGLNTQHALLKKLTQAEQEFRNNEKK